MKLNQTTRYPRCRKGERGSILVLCMVLAGLGTIGAAAFFSLMDAKMMESEQMNTATERRAKRANSLALAKEVVQRKYLAADTGPLAAETHTLPGGWGECTIAPFAGPPMGTTATTRTHKTGAVPQKAYSFDIDVEIGDGDIKLPRQFQVKSYNPMLGGDLLYMGRPTIDEGANNTVGGNVNVKGRARLWSGGYKDKITIKADRYIGADPKNPKLVLNDTSDKPVMAQNFPFPNMTAGRYAGGASARFDGTGSVVSNPDALWNTYADKVATYGASADDGEVEELDGDVKDTGEFVTKPVQLSPPGGPYSAGVVSVIQQAYEARLRLWMAVVAVPFEMKPVTYSYADVTPGVPSLSTWHTTAVVFDPATPLTNYPNFLAAANQLGTDLQVAMVALGGPDPIAGQGIWWPNVPDLGVIIPPVSDPYWVLKNPYMGNGGAATSDGNGGLNLKLEDLTSNVHITNNAESIVFEGAVDEAAADLVANDDPLLIVVTNTAASTKDLASIEFKGWNKRRMILAIKNENSNKTITLTHTGNAFPEWRMLANLENVALTADLSAVSGVTLKGGIWTDRDLEVPNGTLTIEREEDPGDLEFMTARVGWLEVYRN